MTYIRKKTHTHTHPDINEHEKNEHAAYSNYLIYVFTMYGKYFPNLLPTTGVLHSDMSRMSASLFYIHFIARV